MQRGTVRRRSPSDTGDHQTARPPQRPRTVSNLSSMTAADPLPEQHTMGAPTTSNGAASNGAATAAATGSTSPQNGPHSLPPTVLDQIRPYQPAGSLMYMDDKDWQPDHDMDVPMDHMDTDDDTDNVRARPPARKQAFGKRMPVDREEVVRLMLQGLQDIGYHQAADVLAKESGFTLASRAALDFQAAVLGGRWSEAISLLSDLGITSRPLTKVASSRSSIASGLTTKEADVNPAEHAKFLIAQQKYLEYLESGQQKKALAVLRNELASSATDKDSLHDLSGYMMCLDREDLYERAKWDGAAGISRRQLLERLQEHISPKVMVPQRRLATLLDQARQQQQQSCLYHDDSDPVSLYTDHQCASGSFPSVTTHVLADHTDEVWRIEWSPNGNLLASASKDKSAVIWQLKTPSEGNGKQYSIVPLHHLKGHAGAVDALAWSPDGLTLVTASLMRVYVWDVKTGNQKNSHLDSSPHTDTISSIQWMPNGEQFVVTSCDCHVVFYSRSGSVMNKWSISNLQIIDFVITPDSTRIVAAFTWLRRVASHNKLKPSISVRPNPSDERGTDDMAYGNMEHGVAVIRIADRDIVDYVSDIQCSDVTSLKLSHDGKRVLVSCAPDELQLFALEPHLHVVRKYVGHVQSRFLIRSSFGATKDRFVLSGSEDGHVYVWQSNAATPLEVLSGHRDTVNAVAWNPVSSRKLFASCSDDTQIRIWQPPLHGTAGEDEDEDGEGEGMEL